MWYEYNKTLFNLNLIRRVFITEDNQLALVYSAEDKRYLTFETQEELTNAYSKIRYAVTPTRYNLEAINGNL